LQRPWTDSEQSSPSTIGGVHPEPRIAEVSTEEAREVERRCGRRKVAFEVDGRSLDRVSRDAGVEDPAGRRSWVQSCVRRWANTASDLGK
jgi:hypothetical protein